MKDRDEMSIALNEAFRAALFLTGSVEIAEAAVLEGVALFEGSSIQLLTESVKAAMSRTPGLSGNSRPPENLPPELKRIFLLGSIHRCCFVLRVLFGLPPAVCAGMLHVSDEEFAESLCAALQQLHQTPCLSSGAETHHSSRHTCGPTS
jgi:hypothetical protein